MAIPNRLVSKTVEYSLVEGWYGESAAKRSGVPLINHIHEGLTILDTIGADVVTQAAFCLHPLLQHDDDFRRMVERVAHRDGVDPFALVLAVEYRSVANEFLSDKILPGDDAETAAKRIRLSPLATVNQMLIADKVQNRKDFITYHRGTHPRSAELDIYFDAWLMKLGVDEAHYSGLCWLVDYRRLDDPIK